MGARGRGRTVLIVLIVALVAFQAAAAATSGASSPSGPTATNDTGIVQGQIGESVSTDRPSTTTTTRTTTTARTTTTTGTTATTTAKSRTPPSDDERNRTPGSGQDGANANGKSNGEANGKTNAPGATTDSSSATTTATSTDRHPQATRGNGAGSTPSGPQASPPGRQTRGPTAGPDRGQGPGDRGQGPPAGRTQSGGSAGGPPAVVPADGGAKGVVSVAITRGPTRNGSARGQPASAGSGAPSHASVTVRDAPANQPVTLNVGVESTNGGVGVDAMELSVEASGDYTLSVETADSAFSTTPDFATPGGPESLGHVRVGHSVPDSGIGDVTFHFRVAKERIGHDEPDQVALYRHHDGAWNELETTLVEETDESYIFAAQSPGLSEFVVGKKRASFSITDSRIEQTAVADGTQLTVRVLVSNTGDAAGTYAADLAIEGRIVGHHAISIAPGGTRQLTFRHTVSAPGTYDVTVGSQAIGPVVVAEATTRVTSPSELSMAANDQAGLGLGVFLSFVALVFASIFRD